MGRALSLTPTLSGRYALLGQQRHELAAAFFVLGGSVRDAVAALSRDPTQPDPMLALLVCRLTASRAPAAGIQVMQNSSLGRVCIVRTG